MTTFGFGFEEVMRLEHDMRIRWVEMANRWRKEQAEAQATTIKALYGRKR